jgi:signal transduction protein with GAF and PtsI domain
MTKPLPNNDTEELEYIPVYDDSPEFWTTHDLGCASALVSLGYKLITLEKSNIKKVQFIFLRTDEIENTVAAYWANQLKINPQSFFNSIKMIKNQIYSA